MPAYKDKANGKWNVSFKYTDWKGNTVSKYKRGFKTKKEAIEYENNFMVTLAGKPDMLFKEFVEQVYIPYINPRTKDSTKEAKLSIQYKFVMPYFGDKKLSEMNSPEYQPRPRIILLSANLDTAVYMTLHFPDS